MIEEDKLLAILWENCVYLFPHENCKRDINDRNKGNEGFKELREANNKLEVLNAFKKIVSYNPDVFLTDEVKEVMSNVYKRQIINLLKNEKLSYKTFKEIEKL